MYACKVSGSEFETVVPTEHVSLLTSLRTTGLTGIQSWVQQPTTGLTGIQSSVQQPTTGLTGIQSWVQQPTTGLTGIQSWVQQPTTGLTGGQQCVEGVTGLCQQQETGLIGGEETVRGLWEQPEIVGELSQLPRVVPFYGKSKEDLEQILGYAEQCKTDIGAHCLLNAHTTYTPKVFPFRGFTLVNGSQKVRQIEQCETLEQRPVWFLFSGMGVEQWTSGMLKEMMKLDLFRCSIVKSCEVLKSCGVDLMQLINGDRVTFTGVESFVYLTAIQIALVDLLRQIGVRPDGLIGQSIGELVCAYVDQCLTHEQALLISYYIAKWVQEAKTLPKTLMAVVGDLTWEQLKSRCPTGVVPVCFDSVDQIMITGPVQLVKDLLTQLRLEGVHVREIELPTSTLFNGENFGLIHTEYLGEILPVLRQYLQTLNIVPKQRSTRWVSTCVPESNTQFTTFSVDYLLKMITSPVMLQHSLRQVPLNAIVIEISPRSLVQTLLKKCFIQQYQQSTFVPTTYGGVTSPVCVLPTIIPLMPTTYGVEGPTFLEHFLVQLGRLYLEGVEFDSVKLFVPVDMVRSVYPVPVEQQLVGLFTKWNVQLEPLSYFVKQQQQQQLPIGEDMILNSLSGLSIGGDVETVKYTVDVESLLEKESYLLNHQVNGRVLYPTTGYLYLVWKSLAQMQKQRTTTGFTQQLRTPILLDSVFGQSYGMEQLPPVCFEDIQIHRATVLREQPQQIVIVPQNRRVLFQINIQPTTGLFEIVEGKNVIVTGRVSIPTTGSEFVTPFKGQWESQVRGNLVVPQEEIYEKFRQYGYEYNGEFQPIVRSNVSGTQGELLWTGKWIPFLDAMLQMNVYGQQQLGSGLVLPTRIRSVKINPIEHLYMAEKYVTLPIVHDLYTNKTVCGCVEITGLQVTPVVLPRGQFYPTITGTTTIPTMPTTTTTIPTTPYGKYFVAGGEQVPFGQWYKTVVGGEQPRSLGEWTVMGGEQPRSLGEWTVMGGEQPSTTIGTFNPRLTHVIIGALDCEFGLELAQWMVQFGGVRYLVLTTQRGTGVESTLTVQQVQQLRYLQSVYGCEIKIVSTLDLTDETECLLFVRQACRMTSHFEGRIGSIFHLGGLLVQQPATALIKSLYHLDKHTRCSTVMPDNGFFVVFGRHLTGLTQTTGLLNVVEGICESRRLECGKHALVVEWTTLFGTVEQLTGVEYKQGLMRLGQLLVKSIRCQLPVEYQQQWEQYPIEQFSSLIGGGGEYPQGRRFVRNVEQLGCGPCELEQFGSTLPKRQWGITGRQGFYLPTRVVEKLNECELVFGQQQVTPLFIVLPFGFPIEIIKSWAQQLRVPVYGLHYTTECSRFETVEQLAQFYWQQIEKVFPQLEKFHLVGHTYGVPVAFEMASRRPQQVLSLVFLDSGLTKTFLNTWFGKETPITGLSEIDALYQFYQLYVQGGIMGVEQFRQVLSQLPTFDERVRYVCGKIVEQIGYTCDLVELEQLARLFVQRVVVSCRYVPTQPLRLTNILVVRPTTVPTTEYAYGQQLFEQELVEKIFQGLRQFVFGKLQVHLVDGEQVNFLHGETGSRIASILNKHLF